MQTELANPEKNIHQFALSQTLNKPHTKSIGHVLQIFNMYLQNSHYKCALQQADRQTDRNMHNSMGRFHPEHLYNAKMSL